MQAYEVYPAEIKTFQDRVTGVKITQLTQYLGHSYHTYFTNNGWWDEGRRLLFTSDRKNATNLYSIELATGEISRLTDFPPNNPEVPHFANDVNPQRPEVYYIQNEKMYALNLLTLEARFLYQAPQGFNLYGGLIDADGIYVYGSLKEDLSQRIYSNLSAGYVGMRDIFYANPDCRIVQVNTLTGTSQEIWQENKWIGHINPSPTQGHLLSFCHEGPWQLVDHRIWILNLKTGQPYQLRPREIAEEKIGHEYWFKNGTQIGYQVHKPNGGPSLFGYMNYDGTRQVEGVCAPFPSPDHIHSNDFSVIASDSGKSIKLYLNAGEHFEPARTLCMHDGSFSYGAFHPHPRFTADGQHILYNSTASGYCNLYLVDLPEDLWSLPYLEK